MVMGTSRIVVRGIGKGPMTGNSPDSFRPVRVAINAQFAPSTGMGGVESAVSGLIRALGELDDGLVECVVVGPWPDPAWLVPYIGPNQRIVRGPAPRNPVLRRSLGRVLGPLLPAVRRLRDRSVRPLTVRNIPRSDGFYESLNCDVVHFPYQKFAACALPMIYNPHDLQHVHYPQFFDSSTIASREVTYPAGCRLAHTIAVAARCVKQDIVHQYGVDPRKIQVIPWSAPTQAHPEPTTDTLKDIRWKYRLGKCFALYPAMTWPHKNHLRLLEALALCRVRVRQEVQLVCTGHQNDFWPQIRDRILALGLRDQVRFLGLLPPGDLRALYRLAQFVVIPTLFEGACLPLLEAWLDHAAVTCSLVAPLSEMAGDAALFFDPQRVESIAEALAKMATGPQLRDALRRHGAKRLKEFSWRRCAKTYHAVYRRAAGMPLTEEDRWFLNGGRAREPQGRSHARTQPLSRAE